MTSLFRREAVEHATRRLHGDVAIAIPASVTISLILLAVVVVAALAFASLSSYARKETVPGWLVPSQGLVRVAPREPGSVAEILVQEGDIVQAGTPLARLLVTTTTADGDVGAAIAGSLEAEARAVDRSADASVALLQAEAVALRRNIAQYEDERGELERQLELEVAQSAIAADDLARAEEVAARGFLSRRDLEVRRSFAFGAELRVSESRRRLAALEREIESGRARLAQIPLDIAAAQARADALAASISQRQADAGARQEQVVVAPVGGRVAAIPLQTGEMAGSNNAVAILVPEGSDMVADLYVPSRAVGFIREGQEVRLMYQAFPHQRFGTGRGRITAISHTVLSPQDVAIPGLTVAEPVFRVRAALGALAVEAYGERIALQPGMLLTADIVIDRRTLIEWLFDPLFAVRGSA